MYEQNLTIPCGVKEISQQIQNYQRKSNIQHIFIPDSVTSIISFNDSNNKIVGAFHNCTNLQTIELPDQITQIDINSFYNCNKLKSVKLPKALSQISEYAFYGCSNLLYIEMPENVATIKDNSFTKCDSLTCVHIIDSMFTQSEGNPFTSTIFENYSNIQSFSQQYQDQCILPDQYYTECIAKTNFLFYIGDEVKCVNQQNVNTYFRDSSAKNNYVKQCTYTYKYTIDNTETPKQCLRYCTSQYSIQQGNKCTNNCSFQYIVNKSSSSLIEYICYETCDNLVDDKPEKIYNKSYNLCITSNECTDQQKYINDNQCVKTCKTVEGKTFTSTDSQCIESCNSNDQKYSWYETDATKQCTDKTQCSKLNTDEDTYEQLDQSTLECINTKQYCNNTDSYYKNIYNESAVKCFQDCVNVWYLNTTDNLNRKICMNQETCNEANIIQDEKLLKYRKSNGTSSESNQCVEICGTESQKYVSFNNNDENQDYTCLNQQDCLLNYYGAYYRTQDYECVEACDQNFVRYQGDNYDKVCTTQDNCNGGQVPSGYTKITGDNQCVYDCQKAENGYIITWPENGNQCIDKCVDENDDSIIYKFYGSTQFICTKAQTCKQLSHDALIYKTSNDFFQGAQYQCLQKCKNDTAWYKNNVDNICTSQYTCKITEEGYTNLIKRAQNGQCLENCKELNQVLYTQTYDNKTNYYCNTQCPEYTDPDQENNKYTPVYKVEEKENTCTTLQSCSDLGENYYTIEDINDDDNKGCILDCKYSNNIYINDKLCVDSCNDNSLYVQADIGDQINYLCVDDCGKDENNIPKVWSYTNSYERKCRQETQCGIANGIKDNQTYSIKEYSFENQNQCIDPMMYQCEDYIFEELYGKYYYNDSKTETCRINYCKSNDQTVFYPNKYIPNYNQCTNQCNGVVYQIYFMTLEQPTYQLICSEGQTSCPPNDPTINEQNVFQKENYANVTKMTKSIYIDDQLYCTQQCYIEFNQFVSTQNESLCVKPCIDENNEQYQIYYQNDTDTYCMNQKTCKENQRIYEGDITICYDKCPLNQYQLLFKIDQQQQCIEECGNNTVWQYLDNEFICSLQNFTCAYNETVKQYQLEDTSECIEELTACNNIRENVIYYKNNNYHGCGVDPCKVEQPIYIDKYDKNSHDCRYNLQNCNGSIYYQYINKEQNINATICDTQKSSCPPTQQEGREFEFISKLTKRNVKGQCVEKCSDVLYNNKFQFVSFENENYCTQSCKNNNIWLIIDQEYKCTNSDSCSEDKPKLVIDKPYSKLCIDKCSNIKFYDNNDNECISNTGDYIWYEDSQGEYICDVGETECDFEENGSKKYLIVETKQCISNAENCLQEKYPNKYIKNVQERTCQLNPCYIDEENQDDIMFIDYYDQNAKNCIDRNYCNYLYYKFPLSENKYATICSTQSQACPPVTPNTKEYEFAKQLTKIIDDGQCTNSCWQNNQVYHQFYHMCTESCNYQMILSYDDEYQLKYNKVKQVNNDLHCLDEIQCKNVPQYIYTKVVYKNNDTQQIEPLLQCVDKCEFIAAYTYHDDYFCVDNCDLDNQQFVWYNNGTDNLCTDKQSCSQLDEKQYRKYPKDSYECNDKCEDGQLQYYDNDNFCTNEKSCKNGQIKLDNSTQLLFRNELNGNTCIEQCEANKVWYTTEGDNSENICTTQEVCSNISDYPLLTKKQNQQCVRQCTDQYQKLNYVWYINDNNEQICSEFQQCLELSNQIDKSISRMTTDYQCVYQCKYAFNGDIYAQYDNNSICTNQCQYDDKQAVWYNQQNGDNLCTNTDKCKNIPSQTLYKRISEEQNQYQCVQICGSEDQQLVWYDKGYNYDAYCSQYDKCKGDNVKSDDQVFKYLRQSDQYQCIIECQGRKLWYDNSTENICVNNDVCISLSNDYKLNTTNNQCVTECIINSQQTPWYNNKQEQENDNICTSSTQCRNNNKYLEEGRFIYRKDVNQYECVEQCENSQVWYITENQDKENQCTNNQCGDENSDVQLLIKISSNKQCIDKCMNAEEFQQDSQNENICIISCGDNSQYVWYNNVDNICTPLTKCILLDSDDYDKYKLTAQTDSKQCLTDCGQNDNDQQYLWYIKDDENYCSEEIVCNENTNQFLKLAGSQCIEQCTIQDYQFISADNVNVCVTTCDKKYYIVDQEKQCTNVDKCKQIENKVYKQSIQDQQICQEQCIYEQKQLIWYTTEEENICVNSNECVIENYEQLNKITKDSQCVEKCQQSEYKFVSSQQQNQCLSKCEEKVLYDGNNQPYAMDRVYYYNSTQQDNICLDIVTCKEFNNYVRINLLSNKCDTQCEDNNVWLTIQDDTLIDNICTEVKTCNLDNIYGLGDKFISFNKNQNGQCVEQCEQYYYEQDEQLICTACDEKGYQIDGEQCIEKSNKLSGGAIAGIFIAILIIVIVITIITFICIKKKNSKTNIREKKSVEMMVTGSNEHDKNIIQEA